MARQADIVLVNPGEHHQIYQSLADELTAREPPVWAGLIATFLRNKGHSVAIVDALAEDLSATECSKIVLGYSPTLVGIVAYGHQPSASTQVMPGATAVCAALKKLAPDVKIIMVGGHVAALPERTLKEERTDFVAENEGTYTVHHLLDTMKSGKNGFDDVPGLWYRKNGQPKRTGPAPLMSDLDADIPGIAWDLLPVSRYRAHNWHVFGTSNSRAPYAAIYSTLGCSFKCTFCCINAPFGGPSYRMRSPGNVLQEIDLLVEKYGVRNIKFADEMFVLNMKHVTEICDLLIERRYDLNIWAYARVDTVNREGILEKLKRAGFNWLILGIESGNERVRKDVNKGFSQDLIHKSVRNTQRAGINVLGNYIFGLPEDDYDSMDETLKLAVGLDTEWANFYSCMAYPGSGLYELATQEGWSLPEHWSGYSQHASDTLPLPTRYLTGGQVLAFRDRAFVTYFSSPQFLSLVERKFGPEAVNHVQDMNKIKLERKYAIPPRMSHAA